MNASIHVDGAASGISATTGKNGGKAGKKGMFTALMALFAKQHGQQQIQTGKLSKLALHHTKVSLATQHQKLQAHSHHKKDTDTSEELIVPATILQTTVEKASKGTAHSLENQQKESGGLFQQKHIGTHAGLHKDAQTAGFKIAQSHISQPDLHKQTSEAKETIATQKTPLLSEPTTHHALADQKPNIFEGKSAAKESPRNTAQVANPLETTSPHQAETLTKTITSKTALPATETSKSAVEFLAEINPGNTTKEPALKTNLKPHTEPKPSEAAQKTENNKTPTTNLTSNKLSVVQSVAAETKAIDMKKDSLSEPATQSATTTFATHTRGRSSIMTQHFQARQDASKSQALTSNNGEAGKSIDQQGLPQNTHTGADSRFAGLFQTDQSIARADTPTTTPHRSFQHLQVMDAMTQIAQSAKDGHTRLDIQLEPAHLGKIQISLQTDAAKQLVVHISVEQAGSQQLLQQNMPQLRHALEQQGLNLGQFSMDTGSQNNSGTGQGFDQRHEWNMAGGSQSGISSTSVLTNTQTNPSSGHGRLNIHV